MSSLRRTTRAWTRLCALAEDIAEDIVLAADEAVSNVVEHAYPEQVGAVHLELTRCPGVELLTIVQDRGTWRPAPDPCFRGRGLLLMERPADTASVLHTEAGTEVDAVGPQGSDRAAPVIRSIVEEPMWVAPRTPAQRV